VRADVLLPLLFMKLRFSWPPQHAQVQPLKVRSIASCAMLALICFSSPTFSAFGAVRIWTGSATNGFWTNRFNWLGETTPTVGDDLSFLRALPAEQHEQFSRWN
jgi:hypothetical protein